MNNSKIDNLIAKYLSGESTPKEKNDLEIWLKSNSHNQEEFNKITFTYQISKSKSANSRKSITFSKIEEKLNSEDKTSSNIMLISSNSLIKTWISIAAAIAIILSVGIYYYLNAVQSDVGQNLTSSIILKTNPAGQKSKIFLPDGSIVWLNSASSISYEQGFNDSSRIVNLEGEAYFDVKKDPKKPFIVRSGKIHTTALGTAFNVKAFDMNNITVSLTKGKVKVLATNLNKEIYIDLGSGIYFSSDTNSTFQKIAIDPEKVSRWKDGLLELSNASLDETINKLERWYGVKITVTNNPVRPWNAEGVFDNEYLENVLDQLSYFQGFKYEKEGKNIFITFKKDTPM